MVILKTVRIKKKKRKKIYFLSVFFLITLLLLVIGLYFLFRIKSLIIKDVVVSGDNSLSEEILDYTKKEISGSFFYFIPRNSLLVGYFFPFEKKIKEKFLRINSVSSVISNRTLSIKVSEKKALGLWCQEESCNFFDEDGILFSGAPNFEGPVYIKYKGSLLPIEIPYLGKKIFESNDITQISRFINELSNFDLNVVLVSVVSRNEIRLKVGLGTEIIISLDEDLEKMKEILVTALNSPSLKDKDFSQIEYIDARFGNKLFYKER